VLNGFLGDTRLMGAYAIRKLVRVLAWTATLVLVACVLGSGSSS
jgi:hypothetical protein